MSTRWYPLYQKGNPQLRIFLPNFWMKIVRDELFHKTLPNRVTFHVHMDMTRYDVKNYLQKIYKVDVVDVRTQVKSGRTRETGRTKTVVKDDDYKVAYVTLADNHTFTYPDIYPAEKLEKDLENDKKTQEAMKSGFEKLKAIGKTKPDLPGWFN